jgi:DNA-binding MarR family transcriptional regulator
MTSNISPKGLRCLENLAVVGASSLDELDKLDPTAPDHTATIKGLYQQGYVASNASTRLKGDPARYSLTDKARKLLANKDDSAEPRPKAPRHVQRARYANPPRADNVAGPVVYGSMTTKRLTKVHADMLAPAIRPGAEQALSIPSRVNYQLHYRDGRISQVTPQPTGK